MVIQPQFEEAFDFNGKLAEVGLAGARGYIDREGHFVWNPAR
jgi:hypothetical protein